MGFALQSKKGFQIMAGAVGVRGTRQRYQPTLAIDGRWDGQGHYIRKFVVPCPTDYFMSEDAAVGAALAFADWMIEGKDSHVA